MSKSTTPQQPKLRSEVAVAAFMRNSAGAMGKGKRSRNRSERQNNRQQLRRGDWS